MMIDSDRTLIKCLSPRAATGAGRWVWRPAVPAGLSPLLQHHSAQLAGRAEAASLSAALSCSRWPGPGRCRAAPVRRLAPPDAAQLSSSTQALTRRRLSAQHASDFPRHAMIRVRARPDS